MSTSKAEATHVFVRRAGHWPARQNESTSNEQFMPVYSQAAVQYSRPGDYYDGAVDWGHLTASSAAAEPFINAAFKTARKLAGQYLDRFVGRKGFFFPEPKNSLKNSF